MSRGEKALVLLVHGSRDPGWMRPFLELAADVEAASGARVSIACLQFCEPGLEQAVEELADEGVREILVVPVFISAQGHVLKDVPSELEAARNSFPGLRIELTEPLGEMPEVRAAFLQSLARTAKGD